MLNKFFTIVILILSFFSLSVRVDAFSTVKLLGVPVAKDFVMSPAKVEVQINPGQKITREVFVLNRSGEDAEFDVKVEGVEAVGDGISVAREFSDKYLLDKFSIDKNKFILSHGEQATFLVTINIPADYRGRSFNEAVLVSSQRLSDIYNPNSTKIITQLGSIFFVKVSGKDVQSGEISDFKYTGGNFVIDFKNKGNVYLSPYGELLISDVLGNEVKKINIDPWFVLASSTRVREFQWEIPTSLLPFYRAKLVLNPGYEDNVNNGNLNLFLISYYGLAYLSIVIFLVVITFFVLIKYFKNHDE
ncbi:MAG: hypothetical protein WCO84_05100 [bacterium]